VFCHKCQKQRFGHEIYCSNCGETLKPLTFEDRINKSALLISENRFIEAEELLSGLYEESPGDPNVLNNIGLFYFKKKRRKEARQWFNHALSIDKSHRDARLNLRKTNKRRRYLLVLGLAPIFLIVFIYLSNGMIYSPVHNLKDSTNLSDSTSMSDSKLNENDISSIEESEEKLVAEIGKWYDPDVIFTLEEPTWRNEAYLNILYMVPHLITYSFGDGGVMYSNFIYDSNRARVRLEGIPMDDSVQWLNMDEYGLNDAGDLVVTDSRSFIDNFKQNRLRESQIVLPSKIYKGVRWSHHEGTGEDEKKVISEVIGVADVKTLHKVYKNCLVVQIISLYPSNKEFNSITTDFYAPLVGIVKSDLTMKNETTTTLSIISVGPAI